MSFTIGYLLCYSNTLRFPRYHWFLPFAPLGTKTNVVSATLVASFFLIPHYFLLLRFLLQKPLAYFPIRGVLKGEHLFLPIPRLPDSIFSDPPFGCFSFCHFSQVNRFLSVELKNLQPPSLVVFPFLGSQCTKPLLMKSWFSNLLIPFLHHWVVDKDTSVIDHKLNDPLW